MSKTESKEAPATMNKVGAFFKDVHSEFGKITWPHGKELIETTKTVTVFILVLAVFVWVCDVVLSKAVQALMSL